ncbi:translation initiation factor IF-2-like [Onychomys torridus]|uniref:translation initiation factor IF-2-like n=1 Tax=Onychomys torridus TaxID=38674 RepID=UPI00167F2B07|nr:translation initiation factor IF-2-like [Onychomys torridus]
MSERGASRAGEGRTRHRGSEWSRLRESRVRSRRTRRRGGAGGERGAGARVSPPPRRATAPGGGGVRAFHPLCGAAQARAAARGALSSPGGDGRSRVGWGGVLSALVPSPGVRHSPSAATAGDLPLAWAHRPRIKLAGPGGRKGDYAQSPGSPGVRVVARGCTLPGPSLVFVMVSRRPPGPRELGEAGERRPGGVGLPAVPPALGLPSVFTPVHLSPYTGLRQQTACATAPSLLPESWPETLQDSNRPPPLCSALHLIIFSPNFIDLFH